MLRPPAHSSHPCSASRIVLQLDGMRHQHAALRATVAAAVGVAGRAIQDAAVRVLTQRDEVARAAATAAAIAAAEAALHLREHDGR